MMACLWCSDDEEGVTTLIKSFAERRNDKKFLKRVVADLFNCVNCLYEYHRIRSKVITKPAERQALLQIEIVRNHSHLCKAIGVQQNKGTSKSSDELLSVDSENVSAARNPLLEVLCYPYLSLCEKNYTKFCQALEWFIDNVQGSFLDSETRYPGLFLLLFSPSDKIRNWAVEFFKSAPMITTDDYHEFSPLLIAIMSQRNQLKATKSNEIQDCISETTQLPSFLFDQSSNITWLAYEIIFSSFQSRALRMFLSNDKVQPSLDAMMMQLKDNESNFWQLLNVCLVLLEKLGSSFWLLSSDIEFAKFIFNYVTSNRSFKKIYHLYESDCEEYCNIFFAWVLALLKATVNFEICWKMAVDIVSFLVDIFDDKSKSHLVMDTRKCLISIMEYLQESSKLHLISQIATKVARCFIKCSKKDQSARAALEKFKAYGQKHNISYDGTERTLAAIFETVAFVKKEEPIDANDAHQLALQEQIGSADCPINLDDDDDDEEEAVVEDEEDVKPDLTSFQAQNDISSPIHISSDDDEFNNAGTILNELNVDFAVESGPETTSTKKNNAEINDKIHSLKHKIGGKLNEENLRYHKTKSMIDNTEENSEKTFEDVVLDKSSSLRKPERRKSVPPTTASRKQRPLRRERLEMELPAKLPQFSHSLPNMRSHNKYDSMLFKKCILRWKASWLEEKRDELDLTEQLNAVALDFECFDDYVKTFWPLMLLETWADMRKDWEDNENKVTVGYIINTVEENKSYGNICFMKCNYYDEKSRQTYVGCPLEEDIVILTFLKENTKIKVFGIVHAMAKEYREVEDENGKRKKVTLYSQSIMINQLPNLNNFKSVQITSVTSLTSVFRQWDAMLHFQSSLLAKDILKPFRRNVYNLDVEAVEKTNEANDPLMKLNPRQLQAVSAISVAVVETQFVMPKIVLIQGPPGTGKSYTIKTAITHLMQALSSESKDKKNRILVCAPSNTAIDEIVRRLISTPNPPRKKDSDETKKGCCNCGDFNLLRIGRKHQMNEKVYPYSLDFLVARHMEKMSSLGNKNNLKKFLSTLSQKIEKCGSELVKLKMSNDTTKQQQYLAKLKEHEALQQQYDQYSRQLRENSCKLNHRQEEAKQKRRLLLNADIICCTLSGAGSRSMVETFKKTYTANTPPFKAVLVDEAGQCCEPDVLIPLQYRTSKLVLVGDPAQLPATVISQKASRYNFGQSLFERVYRAMSSHNYDEKPALRLTRQYRMVKEICAFPSLQFYDNELQPCPSSTEPKDLKIKPYTFLNVVKSREKKCPTGSIHNPVERKYVVAVCQALKNNLGNASVAVISPYKKQVHLLRKDIANANLPRVEVSTVDSYQGQERDAIVLSCVRGAGNGGSIGFLKNPQRMNVALTRAKFCLVVIGNCETLQVDEDWKSLITNATERKVLFNVENTKEGVEKLYKETLLDLSRNGSQKKHKKTTSQRKSVDVGEPQKTTKQKNATKPIQDGDMPIIPKEEEVEEEGHAIISNDQRNKTSNYRSEIDPVTIQHQKLTQATKAVKETAPKTNSADEIVSVQSTVPIESTPMETAASHVPVAGDVMTLILQKMQGSTNFEEIKQLNLLLSNVRKFSNQSNQSIVSNVDNATLPNNTLSDANSSSMVTHSQSNSASDIHEISQSIKPVQMNSSGHIPEKTNSRNGNSDKSQGAIEHANNCLIEQNSINEFNYNKTNSASIHSPTISNGVSNGAFDIPSITYGISNDDLPSPVITNVITNGITNGTSLTNGDKRTRPKPRTAYFDVENFNLVPSVPKPITEEASGLPKGVLALDSTPEEFPAVRSISKLTGPQGVGYLLAKCDNNNWESHALKVVDSNTDDRRHRYSYQNGHRSSNVNGYRPSYNNGHRSSYDNGHRPSYNNGHRFNRNRFNGNGNDRNEGRSSSRRNYSESPTKVEVSSDSGSSTELQSTKPVRKIGDRYQEDRNKAISRERISNRNIERCREESRTRSVSGSSPRKSRSPASPSSDNQRTQRLERDFTDRAGPATVVPGSPSPERKRSHRSPRDSTNRLESVSVAPNSKNTVRRKRDRSDEDGETQRREDGKARRRRDDESSGRRNGSSSPSKRYKR